MGRSRRAAGAVVSSPDFIAMMKKACRDFRVGHEWALLEAIRSAADVSISAAQSGSATASSSMNKMKSP